MEDWIKELEKKHSTTWCGGTLEERKEMFQLAKKICSQEGLSLQLSQDVLLTIAGESGFNKWCVNNVTKDYGIAQFSAKYYLKEYHMTPREAIENPTRCLQIMARNFKAGRQSNWIAYASRNDHINQIALLSVPPPRLDLEKAREIAIKNAEAILPEVVASNSVPINFWQYIYNTLIRFLKR